MAVWKSKILVLGVSHSPNVLPVSRLVQTDQLVGLCQNMSQSFLLAIWYFLLVKCSWQTKALWPWRVLGHGGSGSAEVPCLASEAPTFLFSTRIFCMERFGGLRPAFERWRAQSCIRSCLKGFL